MATAHVRRAHHVSTVAVWKDEHASLCPPYGTADHAKTRRAKKRISLANSTRFGSSSLRGRNIPLLIYPKSAPSTRIPPHRRGAYASSRYVECGLRWTRGARAREALQGGLGLGPGAVSDRSAQDERRYCVRQKRVVLAPVAGVKSAEVSRSQPGSQDRQFADDGGKRNSSPGRARHKPSNHRAGKAGCSPLDLYARVRTSLCILHTGPRVQRAPGLPCALSFLRRQTTRDNSGASRRGK